jgi:hypothetical protein
MYSLSFKSQIYLMIIVYLKPDSMFNALDVSRLLYESRMLE